MINEILTKNKNKYVNINLEKKNYLFGLCIDGSYIYVEKTLSFYLF